MKITIAQYISALKQISEIADSSAQILYNLEQEYKDEMLQQAIKCENLKIEIDRLLAQQCALTVEAKSLEPNDFKNPRNRKYHLRKSSPEANPEPGVCLFCNGPTPSPKRMFCCTSHQVKYAHQQNGHIVKKQPEQEDTHQTADPSKK